MEAIESGVALENIEKYRGSDYIIVHVPALDIQRQLACGFAKSRVGDKYGILNFIGLAFQALFGWKLAVNIDGQYICSGLVARATEKYIDAYPRSPEDMMPGDLAYFWDANSGEPLPPLGSFGRLLNLLVAFVDVLRRNKGDPAPEAISRQTGGRVPRIRGMMPTVLAVDCAIERDEATMSQELLRISDRLWQWGIHEDGVAGVPRPRGEPSLYRSHADLRRSAAPVRGDCDRLRRYRR